MRCSKLYIQTFDGSRFSSHHLRFIGARLCKLEKVLAPSRDHAAPGGWGLVKGMGTGLVGGAAIAVTGTVCGLAFTCCFCGFVCLSRCVSVSDECHGTTKTFNTSLS